MNDKGQLTLGAVLMLVMTLVLGAVFISSISDSQNVLTDAQSVVNESFSLTICYDNTGLTEVNVTKVSCNQTLENIPSNWQVGDSGYDVFAVSVTNTTLPVIVLTEGTDYNLYGGTGIIQYLNTTPTVGLTGNVTLTSYSFYDVGYNKDAGARGIMRLPLIFFAIALLAAAAYGVKEYTK